MEPDEEYTGWQWWLACSNGGKEADHMGILRFLIKKDYLKPLARKEL